MLFSKEGVYYTMVRKRISSRSHSSRKMETKMMHSLCSTCGCSPCACIPKSFGWIFVILGILYLLTDLGWIEWWTVSWWTLLFLLLGFWWVKK